MTGSVFRTAMVGLGKMGLSHLSIARAHPQLDLVAGCDATAYLTDVLSKHGASSATPTSTACSTASGSTR